MSQRNHWLLPEGIEEVLPPQAARLEYLRRRVVDLYASWGYELVMPPMVEYLESLLTGTGHDLDLQTFKLIDQLTGRLMGIRADMTPQVARIDAHHRDRDIPVRLCYVGEVLHTRPDGFAGSRSPLQVGAELYGHGGIESDAEVLCLMLETLAVSGIERIHVDVGHVGVFRGLARQAGLSCPQEQILFDALQRKARPEINALLEELPITEESRGMLDKLTDLHGGREILDEAHQVLKGSQQDVHDALDNLKEISTAMVRHMPDTPLDFDLAELRGYAYHTGVVFAAFVPDHGQEIARGGRYDAIGGVFGRARPARGFSTDLKTLASLGDSRGEDMPLPGILAPWWADGKCQSEVKRLRASGERVIYELPGQEVNPADLDCDRVLVKRAGRWVIEKITLIDQE